MAKEQLTQSMLEMVQRDGASLEELAAHNGLSPSELANQYDLSTITFRQKSGIEAQAEATQQNPPAGQSR